MNPYLNVNTLITRGWDIEADSILCRWHLSARGRQPRPPTCWRPIVKDLITVDVPARVDRAGQNGSGVSQPSGLPDYSSTAM